MKGTRRLGEFGGGFGEIFTGHQFTFRIDDGGTFLTLGLGLFGHGANHRLGELDVLELDSLDIDTPFGRVFVDDREDFGGDLFSLGEEFIERGLASYTTHGGLS